MQPLSVGVRLCWQGLEVGAMKLTLLMVLHAKYIMLLWVFHLT